MQTSEYEFLLLVKKWKAEGIKLGVILTTDQFLVVVKGWINEINECTKAFVIKDRDTGSWSIVHFERCGIGFEPLAGIPEKKEELARLLSEQYEESISLTSPDRTQIVVLALK